MPTSTAYTLNPNDPNLNNVIEFNTDYRLTSGKNNEVIHDLILRLLNRLNLKIDGTILIPGPGGIHEDYTELVIFKQSNKIETINLPEPTEEPTEALESKINRLVHVLRF